MDFYSRSWNVSIIPGFPQASPFAIMFYRVSPSSANFQTSHHVETIHHFPLFSRTWARFRFFHHFHHFSPRLTIFTMFHHVSPFPPYTPCSTIPTISHSTHRHSPFVATTHNFHHFHHAHQVSPNPATILMAHQCSRVITAVQRDSRHSALFAAVCGGSRCLRFT